MSLLLCGFSHIQKFALLPIFTLIIPSLPGVSDMAGPDVHKEEEGVFKWLLRSRNRVAILIQMSQDRNMALLGSKLGALKKG
jgi:hypothetical protein